MPTDADSYLATVARLEPDIMPIDAAGGWASIAISLKRIADAMERFEAKLTAPALFEIVKAMQTLADADDSSHKGTPR
jgi:hypothetical protein